VNPFCGINFTGNSTNFGFLKGVMKSTMGELTDSTNRAEGFAMIPIVWAAGATLGYGLLYNYLGNISADFIFVGL
jgi:hypothetical protein